MDTLPLIERKIRKIRIMAQRACVDDILLWKPEPVSRVDQHDTLWRYRVDVNNTARLLSFLSQSLLTSCIY